MNSKQIVAAIGVVALIVILAYPALSNGSVTIVAQSVRIGNADHVYVTVNSILAHEKGQSISDWKLVTNQSQSIDLIALATSTRVLATGHLPAASYDAMRISISNVTWVFNKTTTTLPVTISDLDANLDFTMGAGGALSITLTISGHPETVGPSKFFVASLNATLPQAP